MRRKVLARIVRSAVERLESRMLLSATLNEAAGSGTISGVVYNDLDGNGHLDVGEPPIAGTTVTLAEVGVNYNGAAFPSVQADVNGNFDFTELAPGQYQLALVPDAGFAADPPGQLLVTITNNDIVTLNLGESANPLAGANATITGTLFNDPNQTGVYNPNDPNQGFLSGDVVYLDLNGNGIDDPGEPATLSSNLGTFGFNVAPGSYELRVVPRTGFHQDAPGYLQLIVYSGDSITANVGENNNVAVSGIVFQDLNGNGVQDLGEPAIAGETVFVDNNLDGTLDPGDPNTVTDSSGNFSITGLTAGFHRLVVLSNAGMIGDGLGFVDVTIATGQDAVVNLGEGIPSSISGVVFNDKSGNGVQDAGDNGVDGTTVFVDLGNDGVVKDPSYAIVGASEVGDIVTITGGAPVNVGDQVVIQNVSPAGYDGAFYVLSTTPTSFTYEDLDAFGNPVTGLPPGTAFGTVTGPSSTGPALAPDGMVIPQGDPAAVSNGSSGGPDGSFGINNLGPGTYTLRMQVPPGANPTGPANASHSYTFTVGSNQQLTTQNFGLQSADLTIAVLSLPTRPVLAGAAQHAIVRVTNVGSLPAFGTADITLYSQTTNAAVNTATASVIADDSGVPLHLLPGQSRVLRFTYNFPIQTPTNSYFITPEVTSTTIEDDNAGNNFAPVVGPVPVTIPFIDLSAAYLTQPPQSVAPGNATPLNLIVTNNGNVTTTGTITLRVYVSLSLQLEPTDVVAQRFLISNIRIRPGHSRVVRVSLTSPGVSLGPRFIIVAVDSGDPLGDTNPANNVVTPIFGTVFN